jgi:pimeloyl-ACP methyl ester carboxylesterase
MSASLPDAEFVAAARGGAHDWVCPPSAARTLAAGLPRATLCVLPDAGHFTFAEQPGRFRAALAELLTRARPAE